VAQPWFYSSSIVLVTWSSQAITATSRTSEAPISQYAMVPSNIGVGYRNEGSSGRVLRIRRMLCRMRMSSFTPNSVGS
jgi:hypothetical protein